MDLYYLEDGKCRVELIRRIREISVTAGITHTDPWVWCIELVIHAAHHQENALILELSQQEAHLQIL